MLSGLGSALRLGARGCSASLLAPAAGCGALAEATASGGRWGSQGGTAALSRLAAGPLTGVSSSRSEDEEQRASKAGLHTGGRRLEGMECGG